jgi:hypothetical protein
LTFSVLAIVFLLKSDTETSEQVNQQENNIDNEINLIPGATSTAVEKEKTVEEIVEEKREEIIKDADKRSLTPEEADFILNPRKTTESELNQGGTKSNDITQEHLAPEEADKILNSKK